MRFKETLLALAIWLLLIFVTWRDFDSLAWFDLVILVTTASLVTVAVCSGRRWLKISVAMLLVLGSLVVNLSLEPVLRSVGGRKSLTDAGYLAGAKAYYNVIRAYRPYSIAAAGGLFLILASGSRRNKSSNLSGQPDNQSDRL